jgi:aflatoxin B1 aldehyde reductase
VPGTSEIRLGRNKVADRFIIHTKVRSGPPASHEPSKLQQSIEQSLHDLQTDSVETMYLHIPDRQTPFEDVAKAMNDAIQQGKFKNFGLSNYTPAEVKSFIDICEQNGYVKPSVYQGHYNAVVRGGEKELFPLLREHNISFVAYR